MLTSKYYSGNDHAPEELAPNQISDRLKTADGGTLWLDIKDATEEEFQMLEAEFKFHPLAMEDMREKDQRPKVVEYDDYVFAVVHEWHPAEGRENLGRPCVERGAEINAFVGRNYLVTAHAGDSVAVKTTRSRWEANKDLQKKGAWFLLYLLLDTVVDDYFPALDAYDERIDTLEHLVLKPAQEQEKLIARVSKGAEQNALTTLLGLRRDMLNMRRYVAPLRDAVNVLLRHVEAVQSDEEAESQRRDRARAMFAYYQDIYDHTIRVVDSIDTYRDLLSGTLDAHLAVASNRLNEIVKVLTSVSIILMTWAGVTGVYGMNFTNMPELHWRYGYPYAFSLMIVLGGLEWLYFRRRHWI